MGLLAGSQAKERNMEKRFQGATKILRRAISVFGAAASEVG